MHKNEDAAELLECWEVLSHSYDDNTKHYEADTKFHEILANATHNVVIKKLFPLIQEGIRQFLSETSSLHTDETSRLHYEVMKAVITHDAAKARETMQLFDLHEPGSPWLVMRRELCSKNYLHQFSNCQRIVKKLQVKKSQHRPSAIGVLAFLNVT